jgi:hypothetical protein
VIFERLPVLGCAGVSPRAPPFGAHLIHETRRSGLPMEQSHVLLGGVGGRRR